MCIFNIIIGPHLAVEESTTLDRLSSLRSITIQAGVRWQDGLAGDAHRSASVFNLVWRARIGEFPVLLRDLREASCSHFRFSIVSTIVSSVPFSMTIPRRAMSSAAWTILSLS